METKQHMMGHAVSDRIRTTLWGIVNRRESSCSRGNRQGVAAEPDRRDAKMTMISMHALNRGGKRVRSPIDTLRSLALSSRFLILFLIGFPLNPTEGAFVVHPRRVTSWIERNCTGAYPDTSHHEASYAEQDNP